MQLSSVRPGLNRKALFFIVLLVFALYVLLPQLHAFRSSWHLLLHPDAGWLADAVALTAGTYLAAAATYYFLAFKPIAYGATLLVQLAAMFVNRLLPGGVGALGVNYAYLHRMKHSPTQAGSVVALNNVMGLLGHGLLLGLTLAVSGSVTSLPMRNKTVALSLKLFSLVLGAGLLLAIIFRRVQLRETIREIGRNIAGYQQRPFRLPAALTSSVLLTLGNVLALECCAWALGVQLPLVSILIIFTFGIGASTAVPTPGGLGGFEAGLTTGLVAYHIASPTALAVALLYRLVSYWLPLVAGGAAFVICQRRHLLKF